MVKKCRIANDELIELFSLGDLYVSDFISDTSSYKSELKLCLSKTSGLVQLEHAADFDKMYSRYWYHSGTNESMRYELNNIVESIKKVFKSNIGDVWLDIGCNDGTLLSSIPDNFTKVGFDPAKNNCEQAKRYGSIVQDYFDKKLYKWDKAKVVTSIAMFYDLEDPISFCNDVYDVMDDDGLWVIQLSYLPLMIQQLAFDNICHEHIEYYSFESIQYLLDITGFKIVDFVLNDVNGGSCRVFVRKKCSNNSTFASMQHRIVCDYRIKSVSSYEKTLNLKSEKTYKDFFDKITILKNKTYSYIKNAVNKGETVWAYGASTKGNTLLQYFNLDKTLISGIAERLPTKFGLKTVGTEIPISSEEDMRKEKPDYLLVLPWHFIDSFIERESDFLKSGGKFIVPCPKFNIISMENGSIKNDNEI